jgi:hypothetical protein
MNNREMKMSKRNWARVWAVLGALAIGSASISACDPYQEADESQPVVVGLAVIDSFYNLAYSGPAIPDTPGCTVPYPDVDQAWAATAIPGACDATAFSRGGTSVCPVLCYPPRTGPAFAPLYTGNLGGSYQTAAPTGGACTANLEQRQTPSGTYEKVCPTGETCCAATTYCNVPVGQCVVPNSGKYTYQLSSTYTLTGVVSVPPAPSDYAQFSTIAVVFNKLLDGRTIQPCYDQLTPSPVATTLCPVPPANADLRVEVGPIGGTGTDQTASFDVIYFPNNGTQYLGASIFVTPSDGSPLVAATRYHVIGNVKDQQGNTVAVDAVVETAP